MYKKMAAALKSSKSFITTPIFYVNAAPHLGHLYSAVLADALHRWNQLKGTEAAIFSTGTDEHGIKVQRAAEAAGISPHDYCNQTSVQFKRLFDCADVSYTDYIRTTDQRHIAAVHNFWAKLTAGDHIYKAQYKGWYSVTDEAFVTDKEATSLKESGALVEWSSEENYIFRLSSFKDDLLHWLQQTPAPVYPNVAKETVQRWVESTLTDLSVSRPRSRLSWGIPVPNDSTQTVYVWLDALVNYLTVGGYPEEGYVWPATVHLVGKDILRFHAVFWPAFLMAAGLDPPERVISHAHWTMGRYKMSKSRGNVVDPFQALEEFGKDVLRYFLLKEGSLHNDGDYSHERVLTLLNSELADTLGNLLLRVTSPRLHPTGKAPVFVPDILAAKASSEDSRLLEDIQSLVERVRDSYDNCEFGKGIAAVMDCLHQTNGMLERHKPWVLVKQLQQHGLLQSVLFVSLECLRLSAALLWPVMPQSSTTLLYQLGCRGPPSAGDLVSHLTDFTDHSPREWPYLNPASRNKQVLFSKK